MALADPGDPLFVPSPQPHPVCALVASDTPQFLIACAHEAGWPLIPMHAAAQHAVPLMGSEIIVAWDCPSIRRWCAKIMQQNGCEARPLVIGVSSPQVVDPFGDFYVSGSPALLGHTIESARNMRRALARLAGRVDAMQIELDKLAVNREFIHFGKPALDRTVHQVQTPLTQVKIGLQIIKADYPPTPAMAMSELALEKLISTFEQMRLVYQAIEPNIVPIRALGPVDVATKALRAIHDQAEVDRIVLEEDETLPITLGDQAALGLALKELLDNALKYSRPHDGSRGEDVTITVQARNRRVWYRVQDSGIGIAPEHMDYIFDKYYQVHGHQAAEYGGTGLGLPIARMIVQKHGSEIAVESTPGGGSIFSFSLPVARK
jgi:signal transduction histidine kinase